MACSYTLSRAESLLELIKVGPVIPLPFSSAAIVRPDLQLGIFCSCKPALASCLHKNPGAYLTIAAGGHDNDHSTAYLPQFKTLKLMEIEVN